MKVYYKIISLFIYVLLGANLLSAQCIVENIEDSELANSNEGSTFVLRIDLDGGPYSGIDYSECAEVSGVYAKPAWVDFTYLGYGTRYLEYQAVALSPNTEITARTGIVAFVCDGQFTSFSITQPGAQNGIDIGAENQNHITSQSYDIAGKVISQGRTYFNEFGKSTQSQSWDPKTQRVWATQTIYDEQGRPALNTFSAPIGTDFGYKNNFVLDSGGAVFNKSDLGTITSDPSTVANTSNTLGNYYSTSGAEPYQDLTDRPYSRTFYDELNPGNTLKTVGGNKVDTNGDGIPDAYPQGFTYTLSAAQELFFAFGKDTFLEFMNTTADHIVAVNIQKTVAIDPHGVEVVSFSDREGKVLATARSGEGPQKRVYSLVGEEGFVDIHLPKGCEGSLFFIDDIDEYLVFDLKTGQEITDKENMVPGVYRIAVSNQNDYHNITRINDSGGVSINTGAGDYRGVYYYINYYDYSLNYYDNAGKLKSSLPPIGFDNEEYADYNLVGTVSHINESLKSKYEYNSTGQLLYTKDPDKGEAWFKYRSDGQIRFSQNELQKNEGKFSYTNYDHKGRAVESGVYTQAPEGAFETDDSPLDAVIDDVYTIEEYIDDRENYLINFYCNEQHFTVYDTPDPEGLAAAFGDDDRADNYSQQSFVSGNVSKSYTYNPLRSSTWYSYDIYGRVKWVVQQLFIESSFTGVKTIDYEYDDITGLVNKVFYQKGVVDEEFIHKYTYDPDSLNLIKVETATSNAGPYTVHADYEYYENGALKRTNIAEGLQGIDYVYNLNGALKAINHPSLDSTKDPGRDANDLFGMMIDYYDGDYSRSGVNINTSNAGVNRYNGNIKAVRWNNLATDQETEYENTYAYGYDRNNYLVEAKYGTYSSGNILGNNVSRRDQEIEESFAASQEITLEEGVDIVGTSSLITLEIAGYTPNATEDYNVSGITYDANGNIQSLKRNKQTNDDSNSMDDLVYHYKENLPNQLANIDDRVISNDDEHSYDIKTQEANNYVYNAIGQLIENREEQITYEYNTAGLVTMVKKAGVPKVSFTYNERGQRIKKGVYSSLGHLSYYEFYVPDVSGKPMAMYRYGKLGEHPVYGVGRLGMYNRIYDNTTYELTDHLGNVRATIASDEEIKGGTDYYPFGMPMPGKNVSSFYRYAFQGQEKDPETGKEAFDLRLWDARIGRWLTTDPAGQYASPYLGMGNNPVSRVDPDGGMDEEVIVTGERTSFMWSVGTTPTGSFHGMDFSGFDWAKMFEGLENFRIFGHEHASNALDHYVETENWLGGTLAATMLYDNQVNTVVSLMPMGGGQAGLVEGITYTGRLSAKVLSADILKGGVNFYDFKILQGGTRTLDFISTSTGAQRISIEYHHVFLPQRWQRNYDLPNWLINNRINVWKLNTIQHSLIDPHRYQFLRKGLKQDVGFFNEYNWFTSF